MPRKTKQDQIDFEKSLEELEGLVEHLEKGEGTLEDSLKSFERGVELTRTCQKALDEAELKVKILADGKQLEDFGSVNGDQS